MEWSFYPTDSVKQDIAWIPNRHYSGIYGLMKLVLPKILPEYLQKVYSLLADRRKTFVIEIFSVVN